MAVVVETAARSVKEDVMDINETYDPKTVEARWYDVWLEQGLFAADVNSEREPYTIMIPPPNVTGSLHMGHAIFVTLQDLLVRWKRMQGFEALWLPGTDHAGIATQVMVERQLADEGTSRLEVGREKFIERVWEWKEEKGGRIVEQMKKLGASCDWRRERFTMDEGLSRAVRHAFVELYDQGLIYRAERMVDWDPGSQTVLSELEVDREEEPGKFWHLEYPLADGSGSIIVGTTRPETMLGDTAVAVHPDDERYKGMIGKMVRLPIVGREIPIIADSILPDPEKGTGAVKVTPAHDPNDFECGQRHDLELIQVIGFDARMNDNCPEPYVGLDRYEARKKVVADFEAAGLLKGIDDIKYTPGRSQRSGEVVEPLAMLQWFVNTEPLAAKAQAAVKAGETRIIPAFWEKTWDHFMDNIRPWCISRQLWWGHRIPAWYCADCDEITVDLRDPEQCWHCGSPSIAQDPDVLDTWFSSALWPFSTLGWPEETPDLDYFYSTDVLETGFDILFFWVARMMMMGCWFMDEVPFRDVFLHAMVTDQHGKKMSKTRGNIVDPLHMIFGAETADLDAELHRELLAQYPDGVDAQGADALRFTLGVLAAQGRSINLDISRIEGYRAFLNKLWNAARFGLMNLGDFDAGLTDPTAYRLATVDRWILHRGNEVTAKCTTALDEYRFNDYADALYHFVWHELCDWYVEFAKPALYDDNDDIDAKRAAQATLLYTLDRVLRLLHPLAPFITEDIWQALPLGDGHPDSIMIAAWPGRDDALVFGEDARAAAVIIDLITEIRAVRGNTRVKPGVTIPMLYLTCDDATKASIATAEVYLQRLARVESVVFIDASEADELGSTATAISGNIQIRIPLQGLIDVEEEMSRLDKEVGRVEDDIRFVSRKLDNEKFVAKAPPEIVEKERAKLAAFQEELATLRRSLDELQSLT